jgi:quercetin dioxygenase-like cupin family protein
MNDITALNLPVFSLPQDELLTVNVNDIPVMKDALAPGVHFQPLLLDPEQGLAVNLATFAPGAAVPTHLHTGAVHGYTLKGKWYYKEYPNQQQTAGSYLYEPSASVHTFVVPEDNTEDTVVLFVVFGGNIHFDENGKFLSILDPITIINLVKTCSEKQGIEKVRYLKGGSVGYSA